jgi:transcriptional regulator with XRE-family HTH domain
MQYDDQVGERITTLRAQRSLSQAQLADEVGIAASQLHRYESGRVAPRPTTLAKLADALGTTPGWLARGEHSDVSGSTVSQLDIFDDVREDADRNVVVRMPRAILRLVIEAAREHKRSPSDEIVSRIEASFARSSAGTNVSALITKKINDAIFAAVQDAASSPEFQTAIEQDCDIVVPHHGTVTIVQAKSNNRPPKSAGSAEDASPKSPRPRIKRPASKKNPES